MSRILNVLGGGVPYTPFDMGLVNITIEAVKKYGMCRSDVLVQGVSDLAQKFDFTNPDEFIGTLYEIYHIFKVRQKESRISFFNKWNDREINELKLAVPETNGNANKLVDYVNG